MRDEEHHVVPGVVRQEVRDEMLWRLVRRHPTVELAAAIDPAQHVVAVAASRSSIGTNSATSVRSAARSCIVAIRPSPSYGSPVSLDPPCCSHLAPSV
jgi:hypothetical protein